MRLPIFTFLFLVACFIAGCQPHKPTPPPVAQHAHRVVELPPEPMAAPMTIRANVVVAKKADAVIAFRYPTNHFKFYDVLASSDPSFDPKRGGITVILRNCYGQPSGDLVVTNSGKGQLFYRIVGHNDYR